MRYLQTEKNQRDKLETHSIEDFWRGTTTGGINKGPYRSKESVALLRRVLLFHLWRFIPRWLLKNDADRSVRLHLMVESMVHEDTVLLARRYNENSYIVKLAYATEVNKVRLGPLEPLFDL